MTVDLRTGEVDGNGDPVTALTTCYECWCQSCSVTIQISWADNIFTLMSDTMGVSSDTLNMMIQGTTFYLYEVNPETQFSTDQADYAGAQPAFTFPADNLIGNAAQGSIGVRCGQTYYVAISNSYGFSIAAGDDPESNASNKVTTQNQCGSTASGSFSFDQMPTTGIVCQASKTSPNITLSLDIDKSKLASGQGGGQAQTEITMHMTQKQEYYVVINGELRKTLFLAADPWVAT